MSINDKSRQYTRGINGGPVENNNYTTPLYDHVEGLLWDVDCNDYHPNNHVICGPSPCINKSGFAASDWLLWFSDWTGLTLPCLWSHQSSQCGVMPTELGQTIPDSVQALVALVTIVSPVKRLKVAQCHLKYPNWLIERLPVVTCGSLIFTINPLKLAEKGTQFKWNGHKLG